MNNNITQIKTQPLKKNILSTSEVSDLLRLRGYQKINDSFNVITRVKNGNDNNYTDLTSKLNIKISKEGFNDTSMIIGQNNTDKTNSAVKMNRIFDKSSINSVSKINNPINEIKTKKSMKLNNNNIINKENETIKTNSISLKNGNEQYNELLPYVLSNYFPYEFCSNNILISTKKLKNFDVIFYFIIEKHTFLLIRKVDKKFNDLYFWNKEEDAKKFGVEYSQLSTPGLYFKTYENFKEAFQSKFDKPKNLEKIREVSKDLLNLQIMNKNLNEEMKKTKKNYEDKIQQMAEVQEKMEKIILNYKEKINNMLIMINPKNFKIAKQKKIEILGEVKKNNSSDKTDYFFNESSETKVNGINCESDFTSINNLFNQLNNSLEEKYLKELEEKNKEIQEKNNEIQCLNEKIETLNIEIKNSNKIIDDLKFLVNINEIKAQNNTHTDFDKSSGNAI